MSENENIFAEALKRARGAKSQAEFADFLGVPQQSYSRYERGKIPKMEILRQIGLKLGVTVDNLLGWPPRSETVYHQKHSLVLESVVNSVPSLTEEQRQVLFEHLLLKIKPELPNRKALEKISEIETALADLKKLVSPPIIVKIVPESPSGPPSNP